MKIFFFCLLELVIGAFPVIYAQENDSIVTIDSILISGNHQTDAKYIFRFLEFKQGMQVRSGELDTLINHSRHNLINTDLFLKVEINRQPVSHFHVKIHVIVKERWYYFAYPIFELTDRTFNEWWVVHKHKLSRIDYGLMVKFKNLRGRNEQLNLTLKTGYSNTLHLDYLIPFYNEKFKSGLNLFLYMDRSSEVAFSTDENNRILYYSNGKNNRKRYEGGLTWIIQPGIHTRHFLSISYRSIQLSDSLFALNSHYLPSFLPETHFLEASYSLQSSHFDRNYYPQKGWSVSLNFDYRYGGFSDWIVDATGSAALPIFKDFSYFISTYLSASHRDNYFYEALNLGYNGIFPRGYEWYLLTGSLGYLNRNELNYRILMKDIYFLNNGKYPRFNPVPLHIHFKIFSDNGYVMSSDKTNKFENRFLLSYGAGIDFVSYYNIVVRLEYALNQQGDKGFFIHFNKMFLD